MRPITVTQATVAASAPIGMDREQAPFAVGFGVIASGTVTYTVQHTFDDVNWFNHGTVVNATTSLDGNYAFPVSAIRLNVTAGTGSATITILQATRK